MDATLRFGGQIHPTVPWATILQHAQTLEALGFDSLSFPDHFVHPRGQPAGWRYDAWTLLAAVAARTTRIRLGTMVTFTGFRNPAVFAKQALTIDHISDGRLDLALGAGWAEIDHSMTGLDMWPPPERFRRFREALTIIDRLLRGEVVTYDGRYYRVQEATLDAEPVQVPRPPLTIGGRGPSMLKLTATFANAWNTGGGPGSWEEVAARIRAANEQIDGYAVAAGRDPAQIRRSFLDGFTEDRPWASLDAFQDFIGRYREVGISEFVFTYPPEEWYPAGTVQPGLVEHVAREVLPALRASAAGSSPLTSAARSSISSP